MKIYWDRQYLEQQLKKGKTYLDLANENRIGKSTIQRALHFHLLTNFSADWSEKEISALKKRYGRVRDFRRYFPNRSISSIHHKASRLGLKTHIKPRKYVVDEKFFTIWNRKMAYVLGWLFSDGNVSPNKNTFRLKISVRDLGVLKIIRAALKTDSPLKISTQGLPSGKGFSKHVTLAINSRPICEDLFKLGCIAKKASRFSLPAIPPSFLKPFVRGYFDGDGSISINKPNTLKIRFVSCNSRFISALASIFTAELGIPPNYKRVKTNLWSCDYYGDNARKICKWMYDGCGNLFLERKKLRFVTHLETRNRNV